MTNKNEGNVVLVLIFFVVVVGLGLLLLARRQVANNYINNGGTSSYQVTTDTSDPTLDKDLNAVNESVNNASSEVTNVNQGINETPVPQPTL